MQGTTLKESITESLRYWEPRRVVYNAVLAVIVLAYFALGLPASKSTVSIDGILFLVLLAVGANICYCAAYLVDIFAQSSGLRELWIKYRGVLFLIGLLVAGIITRFFAIAFFLSPKTT
jgi:hypothetical protein